MNRKTSCPMLDTLLQSKTFKTAAYRLHHTIAELLHCKIFPQRSRLKKVLDHLILRQQF